MKTTPLEAAELTAWMAKYQRAMLAAMPMDLLIEECARRGHQVCLHTICRFGEDRLPPGYPPLAEDDLPFEVE